LEQQLEVLQQKLTETEDKSNKMYLHMYSKEQDQAGPSTSSNPPSRVSVPELMHQLQVTQNELDNIRVSCLFYRHNFLLLFLGSIGLLSLYERRSWGA
jgi:hypothetical protein